MEIHAGRFPLQAEKFDQPPALIFEVVDQCLVIHLDHSVRHQGHPMPTQTFNQACPVPAIREIIGEMLSSCREYLEVATYRGVAVIASAPDNPCPGEQPHD